MAKKWHILTKIVLGASSYPQKPYPATSRTHIAYSLCHFYGAPVTFSGC